jgi:hypothetical protein
VVSSTRLLGVSLFALAACSGHTSKPTALQASIGPIDVSAGAETTQCAVRPLGNTEDFVMDGYDIDLAPGSDHLIVYLTTDAPQADPVNCLLSRIYG